MIGIDLSERQQLSVNVSHGPSIKARVLYRRELNAYFTKPELFLKDTMPGCCVTHVAERREGFQ
jgi:hypothetical protein